MPVCCIILHGTSESLSHRSSINAVEGEEPTERVWIAGEQTRGDER